MNHSGGLGWWASQVCKFNPLMRRIRLIIKNSKHLTGYNALKGRALFGYTRLIFNELLNSVPFQPLFPNEYQLQPAFDVSIANIHL